MFHFVDRILQLEPGKHTLGVRHITDSDPFLLSRIEGRPLLAPSIIGEALGQLGAWNVMAANGFTLRPVAGIARNIRILGEAGPGDTLVLDTTIQSVDDEIVTYYSVATVQGAEVLIIEEGLGPFLPLEQFNDPGEVSQHFDRIHRPGSVADALEEGPSARSAAQAESTWLELDEILSWESGQEAAASKRVADDWPLFDDHFPRKHVLPLSMLVQGLLGLGERLLADGSSASSGIPLRPKRLRSVKMSQFVEPGQTVVAKARVKERADRQARLTFRCEVDGKRVCIAEIDFVATLEDD
ncbi:MAG: hydroxymyristoyl-ACP dehydratase [Acidobacteria bacterium]|nr:MAG: hydroxymyristoyl-ACP dehydratase [Acidobacteriota bacterium]